MRAHLRIDVSHFAVLALAWLTAVAVAFVSLALAVNVSAGWAYVCAPAAIIALILPLPTLIACLSGGRTIITI